MSNGTTARAAAMGRRAFLGCAMAGLALLCVGCGPAREGAGTEEAGTPAAANDEDDDESEVPDPMETSDTVQATLNGTQVTIELEDSETAAAFRALLPLSVELDDLNGNEKYVYLDEGLPAAASNPGTIEKGDVMLFGDSCLVVFYETFDTSYRYTRIGRVADPDALDDIAGDATVEARFEVAEA